MRVLCLVLLASVASSDPADSKGVPTGHQSPRALGRPNNVIPDRCKKKPFLESFPFFQDAPLRYRSQEMALLIEFARFANQRAPMMLRDFVAEKRIYQAGTTVDNLAQFGAEDREATMDLLKRASVKAGPAGALNTGGPDADLAKAHAMVQTLSDSVEDATRQFANIMHSIGEALELEPTSGEMWESACKTHWWPFKDDVCMQLRCTACVPAIASSASVCKMSGQPMSHRCMQKVMGEGYCNFCIVEFTDHAKN